MREGTALEFTPETQPHWTWSPDAIRHVGHLVVELIAQHLTSLPERPVVTPFPVELAEHFLSADAPRAGQTPEEILAEFARDIEPYPFGNGHPQGPADAECLEVLNKTLLETLQRNGQTFLSSTTLDGTFTLRACIINPRTTAADLAYLVTLVRDLGRQLARGGA